MNTLKQCLWRLFDLLFQYFLSVLTLLCIVLVTLLLTLMDDVL